MANVPWLARLLRAHANRPARPHTDGLLMARHFRSLQAVPIVFRDRTVYVDLRFEGTPRMACGIAVAHIADRNREQRLLSRVTRPGDVVFDIGANVGLHTGLLSRLVDQPVEHAFEPNPLLASCLERTVAGLSNARLYGVRARTRKPMRCSTFPLITRWRVWPIGRADDPKPAVSRLPCPQAALDAVIARDGLPAPDVVKCDVEGAELRVFKGPSTR